MIQYTSVSGGDHAPTTTHSYVGVAHFSNGCYDSISSGDCGSIVFGNSVSILYGGFDINNARRTDGRVCYTANRGCGGFGRGS
jgi:hypothetical protein